MSALEIMQGEKDALGDRVLANGLRGQFTQGFDFEVAPGAASLASLNQPIQFGMKVSGKQAAGNLTAAGGHENGTAEFVFFQKGQKTGALGVAAQPIET